jgi:outer membrane protein assembly factor BamB
MRTLLLLTAVALPAAADDWPNWRGPNRDGISRETGFRDRWDKSGPPVTWKASVGVGYSCMAVAGGRLYTMGHRDGNDTLVCLSVADGKPVWSKSWSAELGDLYFEGGPTSTPTVHDGKVYAISRWGDLFCLNAADGNPIWTKNIRTETGVRIPGWGYGGSPVIHENLLLLNLGKAGMALDKDSGKVVWTSENDEAGYSTPVVFRRGGRALALFSSGNTYAAVDVKTGKPAWEVRWVTRYGVNAADPIVFGDRVFISSGYNKGALVLQMTEAEPTEVWRGKAMRSQMNPGVLLDGCVYGIDGDTGAEAVLKCVEAAGGAVKWTFAGTGAGALCAAGGKLIVLSETGELLIGAASPVGFTPTGRAKVINGKCWTAPVLADGRLYCRSGAGDLVCVDLRMK